MLVEIAAGSVRVRGPAALTAQDAKRQQTKAAQKHLGFGSDSTFDRRRDRPSVHLVLRGRYASNRRQTPKTKTPKPPKMAIRDPSTITAHPLPVSRLFERAPSFVSPNHLNHLPDHARILVALRHDHRLNLLPDASDPAEKPKNHVDHDTEPAEHEHDIEEDLQPSERAAASR